MSTQTIWREGDRIRRTDGTGYNDRVSDDQIRKYIAQHSGRPDPLHDSFARAVLAIRAFERDAVLSSSVPLVEPSGDGR